MTQQDSLEKYELDDSLETYKGKWGILLTTTKFIDVASDVSYDTKNECQTMCDKENARYNKPFPYCRLIEFYGVKQGNIVFPEKEYVFSQPIPIGE